MLNLTASQAVADLARLVAEMRATLAWLRSKRRPGGLVTKTGGGPDGCSGCALPEIMGPCPDCRGRVHLVPGSSFVHCVRCWAFTDLKLWRRRLREAGLE